MVAHREHRCRLHQRRGELGHADEGCTETSIAKAKPSAEQSISLPLMSSFFAEAIECTTMSSSPHSSRMRSEQRFQFRRARCRAARENLRADRLGERLDVRLALSLNGGDRDLGPSSWKTRAARAVGSILVGDADDERLLAFEDGTTDFWPLQISRFCFFLAPLRRSSFGAAAGFDFFAGFLSGRDFPARQRTAWLSTARCVAARACSAVGSIFQTR